MLDFQEPINLSYLLENAAETINDIQILNNHTSEELKENGTNTTKNFVEMINE
jgi:hypothetical protein